MKSVYTFLLVGAAILFFMGCGEGSESSAGATQAPPPAMVQTASEPAPAEPAAATQDTSPLAATPEEPAKGDPSVKPQDTKPDTQKDPNSISTQTANPASVYCKAQGGALKIVKTPKGETGVCMWRDGSKCEEWRLFRKQCKRGDCKADNGICPIKTVGTANPASVNCKKLGGALKIVKTDKGETGVCQWRDGTKCEEWRLFHKKCKQGECRDKMGVCDKVGPIGVGNPASIHCEKNGGKLEILKRDKGEIGVCVFKDFSRCEEWAFMKKKCKPGKCFRKDGVCEKEKDKAGKANPASVFCEKNKGKSKIVKSNSGGETGVCVFKDGSRCEEFAFMKGLCKPGKCNRKHGDCHKKKDKKKNKKKDKKKDKKKKK
jgi:hypothetical protein